MNNEGGSFSRKGTKIGNKQGETATGGLQISRGYRSQRKIPDVMKTF